MAETIHDHMHILESILDHWSNFRYEDNSLDSSEAQWYEAWDMILNWLRVQSCLYLSVAPQIRLTNIVYHLQDDTRSTDANVGSDVAPTDDPKDLSRIARIPDFGIFYTKGDMRMLPLIVEIKADSGNNAHQSMKNMIRQTLVQARHVFEVYGGHQNSSGPPTSRLYVFCVVGVKFWMYHLERADLPLLPITVVPSLDKDPPEVTQFLTRLRRKATVWPVFNDGMTDYSVEFWDSWNEFTDDLPAST
ncbi:hypothetical protein C0995_006151 [Termitomyces sp. Mi166|nr:hypothetical protein C0995_006151 [Termitomyces sp. Mi166\